MVKAISRCGIRKPENGKLLSVMVFNLFPIPVRVSFLWLQDWGAGSAWKALVGDFNGDGFDDIAIVDPATGRMADCTEHRG